MFWNLFKKLLNWLNFVEAKVIFWCHNVQHFKNIEEDEEKRI